MVMAFVVAVHAADAPSCQDKEKTGCCANKVKTSLNGQAGNKAEGGCCASKAKTSADAKGGCPFAASACSKQAPAKQATLLSPKASSLASN